MEIFKKMTVAEISETHEDKVLIEQVKLLFQSLPYLQYMNLMACAVSVFAFWNVIPYSSLGLWVGLMLVLCLILKFLCKFYKKNFDRHNLNLFSRLLIANTALHGIAYGLGGILLFSETQFEYQMVTLFGLLMIIGSSSYSWSMYLPTYFASAPLIILPITIKLASIEGRVYLSLVILLVIFLILLSLFNIKLSENFKRSLILRFENLDLIEKLKEQKDEADHANNAKSKFLAAASHDLRQPLYSLSLFTSVLDESTKDPKTRKIVEQINVSVDALKSLFDALLDISKLDAGAVEAKKLSFPVQPLFEKLANAFDMQASEKGLIIKWPTRTFSITSEPDLLEQILRNYLENAIRYTEEGTITVACKLIVGTVVISVRDTGIGIHQDELQDIFTEFHQADNAQRDRTKGLGLGLAIVDRTAKLLEHEISVISDLGIGSTFSIKIKQGATEVNEEQPLSRKPSLTKRSECLLIAIVDDEEIIRKGILQLLQIWGYEVVAAPSSDELLAQLDQIGRQPDVLITDYRLADNFTGLDVITALHSKYQQDIPVLIVTGDTDQKRIAQMKAGHWQVLHKPVPAAKLRAFLQSVQSTVLQD
jgi:signal transduction histidine kinase/ActR/RegA family two-component response regulator